MARDISVSEVDLGRNIIALRKKHNMTIKSMAAAVGVSSSLLSQIERGLANPSITTLKAISDALQEPLYNFFLPKLERKPSFISRAATRQKLAFSPTDRGNKDAYPRPDGYRCERLSTLESSNLEMLRITLFPQCSSSLTLRQHPDLEVAYVETGTVGVQIGTSIEKLFPRDTITILPNTPHRWINSSDEIVSLILAMTIPG